MWTIYRDEPAAPGYYLARMSTVLPGGETKVDDEVLMTTNLNELRDALLDLHGMSFNLGRTMDDHPTIVETWV